MNIITISREFGSGGREFGKKLSEYLGYAYYDREIIKAIANEKGVCESYIENLTENGSLKNFILPRFRTFSIPNFKATQTKIDILTTQEKILKKIADEKHAVIVGRCADVILEKYNPFNIFIYSDMEFKIKRCKIYAPENENLSDEELEKKIKQVNKNRKEYYKTYSDKVWGAKENYHLCINTSMVDMEKVIPLIAAYVEVYFRRKI